MSQIVASSIEIALTNKNLPEIPGSHVRLEGSFTICCQYTRHRTEMASLQQDNDIQTSYRVVVLLRGEGVYVLSQRHLLLRTIFLWKHAFGGEGTWGLTNVS